jgi:cellulose synthase/poly-beta-1,6-N-acetylglucosamine synthase-like glycosyltransferase
MSIRAFFTACDTYTLFFRLFMVYYYSTKTSWTMLYTFIDGSSCIIIHIWIFVTFITNLKNRTRFTPPLTRMTHQSRNISIIIRRITTS